MRRITGTWEVSLGQLARQRGFPACFPEEFFLKMFAATVTSFSFLSKYSLLDTGCKGLVNLFPEQEGLDSTVFMQCPDDQESSRGLSQCL